MDSQTIAERLWAKTRALPNGCIEWTGTKDPKGFGRLHIGSRTDGTRRMGLAHRWAYMLASGLDAVPSGVQLVHLCGNKACVAPTHLSPLVRPEKASVRPAAKPSLAERFWAKTRIATDCNCRLCIVSPAPAAKCIIWTAAEKSNGYGAFWDGTRTLRAHRYSYELVIGPVPVDLVLDHLCRVRICVNPAHLEPVTQEENRRRGLHGVLSRRAQQPPRGEKKEPATQCRKGHEYTPENTRWDRPSKDHPNGRRRCRTCRREQKRLAYRRSRAVAA